MSRWLGLIVPASGSLFLTMMSATMGNFPEPECGECRFFDLYDVGDLAGYGLCRRRAPSEILFHDATGSRAASRFPMVDRHDWCGEFKWPRTERITAKEAMETVERSRQQGGGQ